MEKLVRILEQHPLSSRDWTNGKGENVVINSVEVVVTDGIDTFTCEATDNLALSLDKEPLNKDNLCHIQCKMSVREWENKDKQKVRSNSIRIQQIKPV